MAIRPPEVRAAEALLRKFRREGRTSLPKTKAARVNKQARQRDPVYLAWLRRQPCAARHLGGCSGPIEAAHIRFSDAAAGRVNPGMQRKPDDRYAAPLCSGHHREGPQAQHRGGERAWWSSIGLDVGQVLADLWSRFQQEGKA